MSLYIRKNPNPATLLAKAYAEYPPDGYEPSTDEAAAEWVAAQLAAGWVPAPPPEPTGRLTLAQAESLLDSILDDWARAKGYVDAARCITYANDPDETFQSEGQAMLAARSSVWVACRAMISAPDFNGVMTEAGVRSFAAPFAPYWIT
jgi:hypothetical protein